MPAPRSGGGDSFLTYMLGQRTRAGQGIEALDRALGADKAAKSQQTTGAGPAGNAAASAAPAPPPPPVPEEQPLFSNAPNMVRPQPKLNVLGDLDRMYRMMGRMPTAAETAVQQFQQSFRAGTGRAPTREETLAQLFRQPERAIQETRDFTVGKG